MDNTYFRLHHMGIGVMSIEKERHIYEMLGFKEEQPVFVSEKNQIRGLFMVNGEARIELLEDLPGSTRILNQIGNKSGYIHSAFIVPDIPEAVEKLKAITASTLPRKMPAGEFPDPMFLLLKNGTIIELLTAF